MGDTDYGDIWRSALNANIPFLQQNLLLNDTFYGYLIQKKIFTQDTIEEFRREASSDARILTLVGYLKRRNDQCFENFLSILESTDNRYLKEMIDQSIRNSRLQRQREEAKSSELLKLKNRHIMELEQEVSDLMKKCAHAENETRMEMDRSKHYLEVIQSLTAVGSMLTQSNTVEVKESELEEMEVEMESLKDQVQALETHLQKTTQDLEKTKRQLDAAIESDRKFKRKLGLQEDADEVEVTARIQEMKRSQAELETMQKEMDRINETKDAHIEKIQKLTQDVKRMEADRRRKDLQLKIIKRNKEDNKILLNVRSILGENKSNTNNSADQRAFEKVNLPRIDIGSHLPSARDRNISKLSSARNPPSRPQLQGCQPNSVARVTPYSPSNEPKYCVLCRNQYHVDEACRIHPGAKRDGRYLCCNAADNDSRTLGCRTLNTHLYVQITGAAKDCHFYDQHGKLLFKDNEAEEKRPAFFSGR